ncbi:MAG: hypothetical protein JXX14_25800 [Deltaproteobacteria bacterium]|nr:hypothetical protein [Deltaproteobacteria bacterium]
MEEQSLGPGRKKRIFKRRRANAEQVVPNNSADANPKSVPSGEEQNGGRRNRRNRSAQGKTRKQSQDTRRDRTRARHESQGRDNAIHGDSQNHRRRSAGGETGTQPSGDRESLPPVALNDSAPDGSFFGNDYTDIDTRGTGRNVPAYAATDEAEIVSVENFFSGRKDTDFSSMTDAELDFLKPHEANENDLYLDLPELDTSHPPRGKLMDIVGVKTHRSGIIEPFDCEDLILARGDEVIVETDRGLAIGEVMVPTTRRWVSRDVPRVFRAATPNDMRQRDRNLQKAAEAVDLCQRSIVRLRLVMKLVEVIYLHGGNKAVFYFMAEGRVDFRQLVKELARELHIRVEMRQIGVRDASRMIGGIGTCGLQLCCTRYIREFQPVSIRMAKDQDLVLNPEKVSGQCGRLMCCLAYEEEVYKEKGKAMPRVGKIVETPHGCGRVRDRDILRGLVRVELEGEHGLTPFEIADIRPVKQTADMGRGRRNEHREKEADAPDSPAASPEPELTEENKSSE